MKILKQAACALAAGAMLTSLTSLQSAEAARQCTVRSSGSTQYIATCLGSPQTFARVTYYCVLGSTKHTGPWVNVKPLGKSWIATWPTKCNTGVNQMMLRMEYKN